ncbi:uncharacterized protein [Coffea arabica]|uniref:Integrase catalytic domain-containing protein n=1 Tax=Coffea arabica TaxID=13443 RepID=A0ABM4UYB5_COFAR
MISKDGIRANPDKVKAIMDMTPPRNIKKVQRLAGRMAVLNRFLSKSTAWGSPFFSTLKKGPQFDWTSECQKAFEELEAHIAELSTLTSPEQGETLFIYLAVEEETVSAVLIREEDRVQKLVYYVWRALQGAEPLKQILSKPDTSGRMVKWIVELSEYDLDFRSRTAIKAQALADFIAEGVLRNYEVKEEPLKRYTAKVHELKSLLDQFILEQVPRSQNKKADALSKLASTSFGSINKEVLVEVVKKRAYEQLNTAIIQEMISLQSPWPFVQWGIDLLDPFPHAPGGYEYLVVTIEYFTKLVEAEPLNTISSRLVQKFFWRNIVYRFGIPRILVWDNGRQFADNPFQDWCMELKIQQNFTSVGHPQANGQVKNVNKTILHGLRTGIESVRTGWLDKLPSILWAYQTTSRTASQKTPLALTYGVEAIIPAEIGLPSNRVQNFIAQNNEEGMRFNLDLLEQRREEIAIRMAKYKGQIARHYNAKPGLGVVGCSTSVLPHVRRRLCSSLFLCSIDAVVPKLSRIGGRIFSPSRRRSGLCTRLLGS